MERAVTWIVVEQVPVAVRVPWTPAKVGAKPATRYCGRKRFSVVVEGEKALCTTPDCAIKDRGELDELLERDIDLKFLDDAVGVGVIDGRERIVQEEGVGLVLRAFPQQ